MPKRIFVLFNINRIPAKKEIIANDYSLTPSRYVGNEIIYNIETIDEEIKQLKEKLINEFKVSHDLEIKILENLKNI